MRCSQIQTNTMFFLPLRNKHWKSEAEVWRGSSICGHKDRPSKVACHLGAVTWVLSKTRWEGWWSYPFLMEHFLHPLYPAVLVAGIVGFCGWCIWRFFKKKRPKDKKKKDGRIEQVSISYWTPSSGELVHFFYIFFVLIVAISDSEFFFVINLHDQRYCSVWNALY